MNSSTPKKARTILYGFLLSLFVSLSYLVNTLNYAQLRISSRFQFIVIFIFLITIVVINKNAYQPQLISLKTVAFATVFLTIQLILILIAISQYKDPLLYSVASGLPLIIIKVILFIVSCVIPMIIGTIIGSVNNRTSNRVDKYS